MCPVEQLPGYEEVFTVTDYYDGPRQGIANFEGKPHFYECMFDDKRDDYTNMFWLTPVEADLFRLAMEDWAIWQRWEAALHAGHADRASHPALPEDRARHDELKVILDLELRTNKDKCIIRKGSFKTGDDLVKWELTGPATE